MQTSNSLKLALLDAVNINQKMSFLTAVLNHSEYVDEIQDAHGLQAISGFLDDMVVVMDDVVAALEKQVSKPDSDRLERLERFMSDLAGQMEEDQEDWDLKTVAGNIRQVLYS